MVNSLKTALALWTLTATLPCVCLAGPATANGTIGAYVVEPISSRQAQLLDFGKFTTTDAGTVTMQPDGRRTATGGVQLFDTSAPPSGHFGMPGIFIIHGDPGASYMIGFPPDGSIQLNTPNGKHPMTLSKYTTAPQMPGRLGSDGNQVIYVGATLTVPEPRNSGDYETVPVPIVVNYY